MRQWFSANQQLHLTVGKINASCSCRVPGRRGFSWLLPDGEPLVPREEPDLLGGTVTLRGTAFRIARSTFRGKLYSNLDAAEQDPEPVELKAIPYHLWANREPGEMCVWIRRQA